AFLGAAPAISNAPSGGTSSGSHFSATTAALIHDANSLLNINVSNITINFEGGAGSNTFTTNYTTSHTVQYASDAAPSGTVAVLGTGASPALQTLVSFTNVQALKVAGSGASSDHGGTFVTDASSMPFGSKSITVNDNVASDGIARLTGSGAPSFVPTD